MISITSRFQNFLFLHRIYQPLEQNNQPFYKDPWNCLFAVENLDPWPHFSRPKSKLSVAGLFNKKI